MLTDKTTPTIPPRCYWVVPGRFLAGSYPYNPGSDDPEDFLKSLLDNNIDTFINLTEEDELTHYEKTLQKLAAKPFSHLRFAIEDYSVPTISQMRQIVGKIVSLLENGSNIYLHCRGGVGRTGTVVGCWLKAGGMDGDSALEELARLFCHSSAARFTGSPETEEQRNFVKSFQPRE